MKENNEVNKENGERKPTPPEKQRPILLPVPQPVNRRKEPHASTVGVSRFPPPKQPITVAAQELFTQIDDLQRALIESRKKQHLQPVIDGVELILRNFNIMLAKTGIESFSDEGVPFDEDRHDPLDLPEAPISDCQVHTVRCGYRKGEKVLRKALVKLEKTR